MELVSRWGSPLTSEAPHSLAYPSPVKRRGHTTDLSDCQGSSARPTLSLSFSGCGGAMHISIRQQSTAPLSGCRGNPSCFREGALTSPQPGVSSDLQFLFQFLCVCVWLPGWFCWYSKVTDSVWELVATESEAWHLNCPGNMTACCRVGNINHRKFGADGADMNLAGGHWTRSKIPQVRHHFLSSSSFQSHGCWKWVCRPIKNVGYIH